MEKFLHNCGLSRAMAYGLFARSIRRRYSTFENQNKRRLIGTLINSALKQCKFHNYKFLNPKINIVFRKIFGSEHNKDILMNFLNSILQFEDKTSIKDVFVLNPNIITKEENILYVICKDSVGSEFACEMQVLRQVKDQSLTTLDYPSKLYSIQVNKSRSYLDLKIYFVTILNYNLFQNISEYISVHMIREQKTNKVYLDDISLIFIELPKFKLQEGKPTNPVDKWIYFLKHASEMTQDDVTKFIGDDQILKKAFEELNKCNWSEDEYMIYEAQFERYLDEEANFSPKN